MRKNETHQFFRPFFSFKSIYKPHLDAWNSDTIYYKTETQRVRITVATKIKAVTAETSKWFCVLKNVGNGWIHNLLLNNTMFFVAFWEAHTILEASS